MVVHISWKIPYGKGEVFVTYELPPAIYIHPLHQNTTSHFDICVPKIIEGTIHKWGFEGTIHKWGFEGIIHK